VAREESYFNQRSEPNRYYHVSCLEHMLSPLALLEQDQIKMDEASLTFDTLGTVISSIPIFHPMIQDWFANSGCAFAVEEYDRWHRVNEVWRQEFYYRKMKHLACRNRECTCQPIPQQPEKTDYFSATRTPYLLTDVLAAVAKIHQIDRLPRGFQSPVKE
jgi:hypothetical protein